MDHHHRTNKCSDPIWGGIQRFGAAFALIICLPALAAIALAIRLDSPGPIIFQQRRPGWRGRQFTAMKFRSMTDGTEKHTRFGVSNTDPRITRVGCVLRATKLDELPQLWNIVRGDMRFVGPRPIPIALDEALRRAIPGFSDRYAVKPGLTSLAQICVTDNGLDEHLVRDWNQRFEAERRYIDRCAPAYDVIVLCMTALFVLRKMVI